jgi:hypothetical protein
LNSFPRIGIVPSTSMLPTSPKAAISLLFTSLKKFCLMGHWGWYVDAMSELGFANLKCIHNAHPPQNMAFGLKSGTLVCPPTPSDFATAYLFSAICWI